MNFSKTQLMMTQKLQMSAFDWTEKCVQPSMSVYMLFI